VDISGSCDLDMPPNFPIPEYFIPRRPTTSSTGIDALRNGSNNIEPHLSLIRHLKTECNNELVDILDDLMLATMNLRSDIARTHGQVYWNDSFYFPRHFNPLLHRLLSLSSEATKSTCASVTEALRLACVLYTLTIRLEFGIFNTRAATQLRKLKAMMETWEERGIAYAFWKEAGLGWVKGWMLAMGLVASERKRAGGEWFEARLEKALMKLEMRIEEFEQMMKGFLWIEDIHGSVLRSVWGNKRVSEVLDRNSLSE
jgi:hypothetical protein